LSEQIVNFEVYEGAVPLLVRNVPASVCGQCGEQAFSDHVVDVLERIRDGDGPAPRLEYLYAYDYEEAARRPEPTAAPSTSVPSLYLRMIGTTTASGPIVNSP